VTFRSRSRPVERKTAPPTKGGVGKTEANRRLGGLGLSHRDDPDIQMAALKIVERFRKWTDRCRCVVTGARTGQYITFNGKEYQVVVHWAHVLRTRGAWSWDFGATLPLVDLYHTIEERTPDFFALRGMDVERLAHAHAVKYFREHPDDARWVILNAQVADVIALATEGLEAA
jgi:hypothetical protein